MQGRLIAIARVVTVFVSVVAICLLVSCNPGDQQPPPTDPSTPPHGDQTEVPEVPEGDPESPPSDQPATNRLPKPTIQIPPPLLHILDE